MNIIGIDVGGANLKAVFLPGQGGDSEVRAMEVPFAMWQRWRALDVAIVELMRAVDPDDSADEIAVTMTGELADCFASKPEGVQHIAAAVQSVAGRKRVAFYMTNGDWCRPDHSSRSNFPAAGDETISDVVAKHWRLMAASNWHAMARFGSRFLNRQSGLMIDVGSTTTDLIPILDRQPCSIGFNDYDRLLNQELIYAGVSRTPITGLIQSVDLPAGPMPLAREFFATMDDALLWTGRISDDRPDQALGNKVQYATADGRPRTRRHAGQRLARMVCSDLDQIDVSIVDAIAAAAVDRFKELLVGGIGQQLKRLQQSEADVLIVGEGGFWVTSLLNASFPELTPVVFADCVGKKCSDCGPAYAVAALWQEGRQ